MLTPRQTAILEFARTWEGKPRGGQASKIRELFGVPSARYHQELMAIVNSPEGVQADPAFAHRHQARVERLARARAERRFA